MLFVKTSAVSLWKKKMKGTEVDGVGSAVCIVFFFKKDV